MKLQKWIQLHAGRREKAELEPQEYGGELFLVSPWAIAAMRETQSGGARIFVGGRDIEIQESVTEVLESIDAGGDALFAELMAIVQKLSTVPPAGVNWNS